MSLGSHDGSHDGSNLADQCLDNLTGPGKILVAAAGNEGQGSIHPISNAPVSVHAHGEAEAQEQFLGFRINADEGQPVQSLGVVWFNADADITLQLGLWDENLGDVVLGDPTGVGAEWNGKITASVGEMGPVMVIGGEDPGGSRYLFFIIQDENEDRAELEQLWVLSLKGSGTFDGFIDTTGAQGFTTDGDPTIEVNNSMTIGYPAIASKVLAVASFVTRNEWTDAQGNTHMETDQMTNEQVELNSLSPFSSKGPSRNEAISGLKPTIAAPGEIIGSALNVLTPEGEHTAEEVSHGSFGESNSYIMMQGTSMASPAMAGVVALMLQAQPSLTVEEIITLLEKTADTDSFTGSVPNYDWGHGKVNAFNLAQELVEPVEPPVDEDVVVPEEDVQEYEDTYQEEDTGTGGTPDVGGQDTTVPQDTTVTPPTTQEDDDGCSTAPGTRSAGYPLILFWSLLVMALFVSRLRRQRQ